MDPVRANRIMIDNLEWFTTLGLHHQCSRMPDEDPLTVMGLRFPNAVGLAAGLDRSGEEVCSFGAFGLGFVEAGTITPQPQRFSQAHPYRRDDASRSILHAAEFENAGAQAALARLRSADAFYLRGGVTGISIGAGSGTAPEGAAAEIASLIETFFHRADYFSLNLLSCSLSEPAEIFRRPEILSSILRTAVGRRDDLACRPEHAHLARRPIVVKLPGFLADDELKRSADICAAAGVDGISAGGPLLKSEAGRKPVFVSGAPARERSTAVVSLIAGRLKGALALIASGGILSTNDVVEKIDAGADLVQILSGFIFNGPGFVADCVDAAREARASRTAPAAA